MFYSVVLYNAKGKRTNFKSDSVEFLFFEVMPEQVSVAAFLLYGELPEGEVLDAGVAGRHPQGAAALCGHTGEALSAAEVVHCHVLEVHITAPKSFGILLQRGWERRGILFIYSS